MKKRILGLTLLPLLASLGSCHSLTKFLDRPEDTNLLFWITEKVDVERLKGCTLVSPGMGVDQYLDSRYEATEQGDGFYEIPNVHVTYSVSSYPDYSDGGSYVTSISITDPEIYVYGLTMNSDSSKIAQTLRPLKFQEKGNDTWFKNNCYLSFRTNEISLSAQVTNKKGLIF